MVRTATNVAEGEKLTVRFAEDQMVVAAEGNDRSEVAQITSSSA